MSETVHYKGKIKEIISASDQTLEELCKQICLENIPEERFLAAKDWCDTYQEMMTDELYEKFIVVNGKVYEVLSQEQIGEFDIFSVKDNGDSTFDYEVMYYNSGCSFDEAINEAFSKVEEVKNDI